VFAYDPTEWHDLFVATTGASAALTGLVFVAISINIERILALSGVPERGLETVLLLLLVLIVSIVGLIPGQSHLALALELLGSTLAISAVIVWLPPIRPTGNEPRLSVLARWMIRLLGTGLFLIGGLSLLVEVGGGLYWVVAGIVFATAGAAASAWVLLVEILR
jgi:modulator of FtsH protease